MLKFIHAADLHLDSPFHALSPGQAAARRQGQRQGVERLMELCEAEGADFLLLAGDMFDSRRVYPETLAALTAALGRSSMPVFISPGNHDPYEPGSRYLTHDFPSNVHIFSSFEPKEVVLEDKNAVIYGNAFLSQLERREPLEGFRVSRDGSYHVGVIHGDVDKPGSDYAPITSAQIEGSGLHYLALGHVHRRTPPARLGQTVWAYAGCPEGRGFDEEGDMGCYVVSLDGDGVEARFVPLAEGRYFSLTAQGEAGKPWRAVLEEILSDKRAQDVVRVTFTGEVSEERPDLPALEQEFSDRCAALTLRDGTVVSRDLWARAEEDTLTGLYLKNMKAIWDKASEEERQALTLSLRYGLAALEDGEEVRP